jgi:hypothetical protein
MHLDPHAISRIPKVGYSLIVCDHFRSYPPSVGYVVMDVPEISSKGVGIVTSSFGVRSASH